MRMVRTCEENMDFPPPNQPSNQVWLQIEKSSGCNISIGLSKVQKMALSLSPVYLLRFNIGASPSGVDFSGQELKIWRRHVATRHAFSVLMTFKNTTIKIFPGASGVSGCRRVQANYYHTMKHQWPGVVEAPHNDIIPENRVRTIWG